MTNTAVEAFITADDQLHHAAQQAAEGFRIEWDDTVRTYTAGDRAAMVTTLIDDDTSIETGWEWTLLASHSPSATISCTTAELDTIRDSIVNHLNH